MSILVVGSAHLDVLAQAGNSTSHVDKIGNVAIEVGGTANNVALGLRRLGVASVVLATAWGPDPINKAIAEYIKSSGITLNVDEVKGMPLAAFVAQLDTSGEMRSAVSSVSIDSWTITAEKARALLRDIQVLVVEANLNAKTIEILTRIAQQMGVMTFGLGVSEDKVDRIGAGVGFRAVFVNQVECARLCAAQECPSPAHLAAKLKADLIVTAGSAGVNIFSPSGDVQYVSPPLLNNKKNTLGAGDAFTASVIAGMIQSELDLVTAAKQAGTLVEEVAASSACNSYSRDAFNLLINTARHDQLTRLFTRGPFEEEYERHQGRNTLLFIDCDRFKAVNDQYGHEKGDEVLVKIARILKNTTRSVDVVCRFGGDEFVVLITRTQDTNVGEMIAGRMIVAAQAEDLYGVTLSIGIALCEPGTHLKDALMRADKAVYIAKQSGRNRAVIYREDTDVTSATEKVAS